MNIKFQRERDNRWYAVLPYYPGNREDLEMVMGADVMLDIITINLFDDSNLIELNLLPTNTPEEVGFIKLIKSEKSTEGFGGSFYICEFGEMQEFEIWLCDVTYWVFGEFPKYISII